MKTVLSVYSLVAGYPGELIERDAIVTPFLAETKGRAVKRDGVWYSVKYPGFRLEAGEVPRPVIVVREEVA